MVKGAVKIRPKKMELGNYNALTYVASLCYRGITWYLTDFGGKGEREDWVADVPGAGLHVCRYVGSKEWGANRNWFEAVDALIMPERARLVRRVSEVTNELKVIARALITLETAKNTFKKLP